MTTTKTDKPTKLKMPTKIKKAKADNPFGFGVQDQILGIKSYVDVFIEKVFDFRDEVEVIGDRVTIISAIAVSSLLLSIAEGAIIVYKLF
jgi:hypothetical protein